jgi:hypothetical protein
MSHTDLQDHPVGFALLLPQGSLPSGMAPRLAYDTARTHVLAAAQPDPEILGLRHAPLEGQAAHLGLLSTGTLEALGVAPGILIADAWTSPDAAEVGTQKLILPGLIAAGFTGEPVPLGSNVELIGCITSGSIPTLRRDDATSPVMFWPGDGFAGVDPVEVYAQVGLILGEDNQAELAIHMAFTLQTGSTGLGLLVPELWTSRAQQRRYADARLMPAIRQVLTDMGIGAEHAEPLIIEATPAGFAAAPGFRWPS